MTAAVQDEEDCGRVAAACLGSCIGGGWRPQRRWSGAKMVLAVVADGSAAGGCWVAAAEGWFVGLGWWLMAFVGSFFLSFFSSSFFFFCFFFCLWFVGCGGWLFWQLVWCFNGGQDWQMGFVGCWVKGLWLTGNLLVAWYVWVLRYGFLMWFGRDVVKGFWRWCGGWISGGGKYTVKVFFFFVWFWIDLRWCFKWISVCFDTKTNAGQSKQNWNNGKIKDMT